jgi:hypothetical protein
LQRENMSLQVPRPQHPDTTPDMIAAFKKNCSKRYKTSVRRMGRLNSGLKTMPG